MSSEVVIFTPIFYSRDRTTVARGNTEGSGQLSYTVDSVTKRDEGSYSCKVSKRTQFSFTNIKHSTVRHCRPKMKLEKSKTSFKCSCMIEAAAVLEAEAAHNVRTTGPFVRNPTTPTPTAILKSWTTWTTRLLKQLWAETLS